MNMKYSIGYSQSKKKFPSSRRRLNKNTSGTIPNIGFNKYMNIKKYSTNVVSGKKKVKTTRNLYPQPLLKEDQKGFIYWTWCCFLCWLCWPNLS